MHAPLSEQLSQNSFHESAWIGCRVVSQKPQLLDESWLSNDPPHSAARSNEFGECVDSQDSTVGVDLEVRWCEGSDEGLGGRFWDVVLERPEGLVFENQDIVFLTNLIYLLLSFQWCDGSFGVLSQTG